ncbi:MAG: MoaD/ThiS family protein [Deltaproteobacteria bacterium]|nr:MoaD/ThiS family protein [Deltaproteobacteria bacterium]MBW2661611.1 MoaD/ThiS family protein [Deltaproteobacteria bacterium]
MAKPHSVSIRVFGFLRHYMDEQGLLYAFNKDIDAKGETAYDIAVELHIPPEEIEGVFVNGSVKNIYDFVFASDRVAFLPYGTPGPYRVFLGMARENIERARREKTMASRDLEEQK